MRLGVTMRKLTIFMLAAVLTLTFGCGSSDQSGADMRADRSQGERPQEKSPSEGESSRNPDGKPGQKGGMSNIDVDSLDIPEQMKEAIKSGKIPPDQVREMLARIQGGGDAVPVSVEPVRLGSLNSYLVLNGIVEPERMVEIFSRLSAYVKRIVKEEGDYVKENEVLATLDDQEIRISYDQSKIELEQARLSLEEARNNYTRNQELMKRELISEQEFQTLFVNNRISGPEFFDFCSIYVNTDDIIACIGQAGSRDKPDIAGADNRDFHYQTLLSGIL